GFVTHELSLPHWRASSTKTLSGALCTDGRLFIVAAHDRNGGLGNGGFVRRQYQM
ncbi:Hypothetical predicted protein, partial [Olea europaea subsp. europaea]